jgi:hypothetical protein
VTTQLRLVEPPETPAGRASRPPKRRGRTSDRPRTASVARSSRTGRRSANWGDWHLDARTRKVGRAGVASARRALEAAVEQELSQAS